MIDNIDLILIESLHLDVSIKDSLANTGLNCNLITLLPCNTSLSNKYFGFVLFATVSIEGLASI